VATKGNKLTDFITSGWYNEVTRKLGIRTGIPRLDQSGQYWFINVFNHTDVYKPKWTTVSLGNAALDYDSELGMAHNAIMFYTKDYDENDPDNLAILLEPLPGKTGESAKALLSGISWMRVPEHVPTDKPYIHIEAIEPSGIPGLAFSTSGRIEILRTFAFTVGAIDNDPDPPPASLSNVLGFGPAGAVSGALIGPLSTAPATPPTIHYSLFPFFGPVGTLAGILGPGFTSTPAVEPLEEGYIGLAIIGKKLLSTQFFVFRLNETWTGGSANADLYSVAGETITDTMNDILVYDPLSVFGSLDVDDYGWCFLQNGKYYAIQAPCPIPVTS
jgi:hypothetical protein